MSGIDDPINATIGLPGGADLNAAAERLDAVTASLRGAVRNRAGLLAAARVVLELAGVAVKGAGVPLGSTAVDLARVALEMASGERGS